MCPDIVCHRNKCINNYNLYDFINKNYKTSLEWESTILFYGAMHSVHYFLAHQPLKLHEQHPDKHEETNKLVSKYLQKYASDYLMAYQYSRWARYYNVVIDTKMRDTCLKSYNELKTLIPP
jgi:hemerythrin superfamily protein